ncbi:MAG: hypothetical protein RL233_1025 [Bacteroidota bacterium]
MKKQNIVFAIVIGLCNLTIAQSGLDFNNRHLAQSNDVNPAFLPQYKFTLGFGSGLSAYYPGYNIKTFYAKGTDAQSTIRNIINDSNVELRTDFINRNNLLNMGIRGKKSYFSVNTSINTQGSLVLPKDILGMAMFGNQEYFGKRANFDISGTEFMSYAETKYSYGRMIGNKLTVGVSYSRITGLVHANLKSAYAFLETDTNANSIYQLRMGGAFDAQTSLLGLSVMKALNDSAYDAGKAIQDAFQNNFNSMNPGSAMGFGFVYRMNEKFRFSGAVNNIGKITWNMGAEEHHMAEKPWTFTGIDTSQFSSLKNGSIQDILLDSFSKAFDNHSTKLTSYETKLHARYNIGVEYFFTPRTYLQLNYGGGYGIKGDKSFTNINIHKELGEWVDLRLNYGIYDYKNPQHSIGFGMSLNLGPVQPWMSFNTLSNAFNYAASHRQSIQFGLNINIGIRKDRDGDGIRDKADSCYKTFGVMSNNGCPLGFLGGSMNYDEQTIDTTATIVESTIDSSEVKADIKSESSAPVSESIQEIAPQASANSEFVSNDTEAPKAVKPAKAKKAKKVKKSKTSDVDLSSAMKE